MSELIKSMLEKQAEEIQDRIGSSIIHTLRKHLRREVELTDFPKCELDSMLSYPENKPMKYTQCINYDGQLIEMCEPPNNNIDKEYWATHDRDEAARLMKQK